MASVNLIAQFDRVAVPPSVGDACYVSIANIKPLTCVKLVSSLASSTYLLGFVTFVSPPRDFCQIIFSVPGKGKVFAETQVSSLFHSLPPYSSVATPDCVVRTDTPRPVVSKYGRFRDGRSLFGSFRSLSIDDHQVTTSTACEDTTAPTAIVTPPPAEAPTAIETGKDTTTVPVPSETMVCSPCRKPVSFDHLSPASVNRWIIDGEVVRVGPEPPGVPEKFLKTRSSGTTSARDSKIFYKPYPTDCVGLHAAQQDHCQEILRATSCGPRSCGPLVSVRNMYYSIIQRWNKKMGDLFLQACMIPKVTSYESRHMYTHYMIPSLREEISVTLPKSGQVVSVLVCRAFWVCRKIFMKLFNIECKRLGRLRSSLPANNPFRWEKDSNGGLFFVMPEESLVAWRCEEWIAHKNALLEKGAIVESIPKF